MSFVADGDSFTLADGRRIRLIGIDSPERGQPMADEARRALEKLVLRKKVRLERDITDRDRYGRLLRYVYVGDIFVNGEMVRRGYAVAKRYPPDERRAAELEALQESARRKRLGIWK